MFRKKRIAFTLAEVLVTLGIIGVIAAVTIPMIVSEYQKTKYVAQLQKFYATFQIGLKQYAASQGCDDLRCTGNTCSRKLRLPIG
jgi:prepilin-type N-terminal cleavage/methylation domain-containing protein